MEAVDDEDGETAFLISARFGEYGMMQFMLEEADVNNAGNTVWDLMIHIIIWE
jgi:ankyrin repeat protein